VQLIVHYSSHVGGMLQPALGPPSRSVFDMARRGLRHGLRAALHAAVETGRAAEQAVQLEADGGGLESVTLVVEPLPGQEPDRPYLIVFKGSPGRAGHTQASPAAEGLAAELDRELRDTREQLQSLNEEHETALEELRSSNEELHSVNEELQSSNEELETSKEEIQSVNEELHTVNAQLSTKVDELDQANSDLRNLFESTRVATVFLDQHMVIRAFTPEVAGIYNLIPSDRGRPLTDIVSRLDYDGLREEVQQVLHTLKPLERRVSRQDGTAHYLLRVLPYRAPDSTVDGSLVTFVDMTRIVQAEQHQRQLEEIVAEELRPFMAGDRTNVRIMGPAVPLDPRGALVLGMAIHELATNAAKYGALSVPEGDVAVTWAVERTSEDGTLVLDWTEQNGPPQRGAGIRDMGALTPAPLGVRRRGRSSGVPAQACG